MTGAAHSTYELLRHLADSWGLVAMTATFLVLCAWPFRPGARQHSDAAARMIFRPEEHRPAENRPIQTRGNDNG
ncbi:MAG: cbb3-type cytochrome c oxidase subunit 3 [Pseudomonadota bacterium]